MLGRRAAALAAGLQAGPPPAPLQRPLPRPIRTLTPLPCAALRSDEPELARAVRDEVIRYMQQGSRVTENGLAALEAEVGKRVHAARMAPKGGGGGSRALSRSTGSRRSGRPAGSRRGDGNGSRASSRAGAKGSDARQEDGEEEEEKEADPEGAITSEATITPSLSLCVLSCTLTIVPHCPLGAAASPHLLRFAYEKALEDEEAQRAREAARERERAVRQQLDEQVRARRAAAAEEQEEDKQYAALQGALAAAAVKECV